MLVTCSVIPADTFFLFACARQVGPSGDPAGDLGQCLISDVSPEDRRKYERGLVDHWHTTLCEAVAVYHGPGTLPLRPDGQPYTKSDAWDGYRRASFDRWVQMIIMLATFGFPEHSLQWFINQVDAFYRDHGDFCLQDNRGILFRYCYPLLGGVGI